MTTDFLLEELLRFAYAVTLVAVPTLAMAMALFASILAGAWATWRLSGRHRCPRVRGTRGINVLVQGPTQAAEVAGFPSHPHPRPVARTICPIT